MLVWALKMTGACLAVWVIGSIGGMRASLGGMAQVVAGIVFVCAMLLRIPVWAPHMALWVRVGLIASYFFTRRGPPKHQRRAVFAHRAPVSGTITSRSSRSSRRHNDDDSDNDIVGRANNNLKRSVLLAVAANVLFLLLAAVSAVNNTIITCAYREHLSLRELILIAVNEHGACGDGCVFASGVAASLTLTTTGLSLVACPVPAARADTTLPACLVDAFAVSVIPRSAHRFMRVVYLFLVIDDCRLLP
jgi:hypothetical protein